MSDTPRTDAERGFHDMDTAVDADFAEHLELELAMRTAEVEMLRGVGCGEDGDGPCGVCVKCLKLDARRYRTIREVATNHMIRTLTDWAGDVLAPGEELDAAVDTAIAAEMERCRMEAGHA